MNSFTIESQSDRSNLSLRFESGEGRLIALGEASGLPDAIVRGFRSMKDIFYSTHGSLSPEELSEEIKIHVPEALHNIPKGRIAASAMGGLALMQYVHPAFPVISPLAAVAEILRVSAAVNYGILQADNSSLLFMRRAGAELQVYASAHSLKSFLDFSHDEREAHFPGFHADEVVISGSDLDHFESLDLDPMEVTRRITLEDLSSLCERTDESSNIIGKNAHLYTLAIGAARVYAMIGGWL